MAGGGWLCGGTRSQWALPWPPGAENVKLAGLLPLLDELDTSGTVVESGAHVLPAPATKMDANALPEASRLEFNAGRALAAGIDR